MSAWNEIVLKITGRANVKPALDQVGSDLLGRGPQWARLLLHGFQGGIVAMAFGAGKKIGNLIEEGISDSAGFFAHYWRKFESSAVQSILKAEEGMKSLVTWANKGAVASERIRVKNLNRDLDQAATKMQQLAQRSDALFKGESAKIGAKAKRDAAGLIDPVAKMAVQQRGEQDVAHNDLMMMSARAEDERRSAEEIAGKLEAERESLKYTEARYAMSVRTSTGSAVDMEKSKGLREQRQIQRDLVKSLEDKLGKQRTAAEVAKSELDTAKELLSILRQQHAAELQLATDEAKQKELKKWMDDALELGAKEIKWAFDDARDSIRDALHDAKKAEDEMERGLLGKKTPLEETSAKAIGRHFDQAVMRDEARKDKREKLDRERLFREADRYERGMQRYKGSWTLANDLLLLENEKKRIAALEEAAMRAQIDAEKHLRKLEMPP